MKIKKLILNNINSLYGTWIFDFTKPEFSDGIFAITGNTGSGKSTILDAICLALYTETPRMNTNREEIASRGTRHFGAELTFEIDSGENRGLYVASYKAALKKKSNEISSYSHELSKNGVTVAEKMSEVVKYIIDITGLNMKQFCQTVLLAQGNFNAFLKAKENEKAEILEDLTGTSIFTKISEEVFKRCSEQKNKIALLEAELNGAVLLSEEEIALKQAEMKALNDTGSAITSEKTKLDSLLKLFDEHTKLLTGIQQNEIEFQTLQSELDAFQENDKKLELHAKTLSLTPLFLEWNKLREEDHHDQTILKKLDQQIPGKTAVLQQCRINADQAKESDRLLSAEIESAKPVWEKAERLDLEIDSLKKKISIDSAAAAAEEKRLKTENKALKKAESSLKKAEEEKQTAETYLKQNGNDAKLPEKKAKWQEQLKNLSKLRGEETEHEKTLKNITGKVKAAQTALKKGETETAVAEEALKKAVQNEKIKADELSAILSGETMESLENMEKKQREIVTLRREISNLSDLRKTLSDGIACPLCGSKEHPFAAGNIPEVNEAEKELQAIEERLKKSRNISKELLAAQTLTMKLTADLQLLQNTLNERREQANILAQENLVMHEQNLKNNRAEQEFLIRELTRELAEFGIAYSGEITLPDVIGQRIAALEECRKQLEAFESQRIVLEQEITRAGTLIREITATHLSLKKTLQESETAAGTVSEERTELFGSRDPKKIREEYDTKQQIVRKMLQECEKKTVSAESDLNNLNQQIKELRETVAGREPEMKRSAETFLTAAGTAGFTEESYRAACLPEKEVIELTQKQVSMKNQKLFLFNQKQSLEKQLQEVRKNIPEDAVREKIAEQANEIDGRLRETSEKIGSLKTELEKDRQEKERYNEKLQVIEKEKKSSRLLEELNLLIGSANGAKFSRIAQGITLDRLLNEANRELKKMFPRYELIRHKPDKSDEKKLQSLDIDVIDHYQGGIIRTTDNLSGGESFLISLSLAWGLSSMAGEKISIQNLFMDEGFGSLDSTARDYALETLAEVQRTKGKMIGIISHVPEVREKIPCLIEVSPIGNGMSVISGPGVSKGA